MKNQVTEFHNQEEIGVRNIIISLWKQKMIIICVTLFAALLSGCISIFVLSPVYDAKLNVIINMPENYHTKYGDYILPLTTNQQYISLITSNDILINTLKDMGLNTDNKSIEDLKKKISPATYNAIGDQNSFEIKISSNNPTEAQQIATVLYNNYIKFIDVLTAEEAFNYYFNLYSCDLKSLKTLKDTSQKTLVSNQKLLSEIPQMIDQKEAMKAIKNKLNESQYVIIENTINTNYTYVEHDIIDNKKTINDIENSITIDNNYLNEIKDLKNIIFQYKKTGNYQLIEPNIFSISKTNIYLQSNPIVPNYKTSPNYKKNIILGTLLGGMIGISIVLLKVYWLRNKKNIEGVQHEHR